MLNFRQILFPIDFSERCREAAPYVAGIARRFEGRIVALHVLDVSLAGRPGPLPCRNLLNGYENLVRQTRDAKLKDFALPAFDGLAVTKVLEVGDAAETITRYAEQNEIDLIVMPTHGLGTFRCLLLGSVTAKVLHDAACPVWTTMHSEALPPAASNEIHTIICGIDLYSEPVRVVRAASDVAARYGAVVRLVHAIAAPEAKPGSNMDSGLKQFLFDRAREQIEGCQDQAGTHWEICIRSGAPSHVVRNAALQADADLVIIGRGHLPNRFGRLRTNVGAIIRESPCPVLSL